MELLQPRSWGEALAAKAEHPDAVALAGGTDLMVGLNYDQIRPEVLLDLGRVAEIAEWAMEDGTLRVGAGVTFTRVIDELGAYLPGLAMASRTVGSPQIRNRGTVGGNLATASPAGDAHPPLLAGRATVEVASVRGARRIPIDQFYTGPKRQALAPDELIAAISLRPAAGPEQFAKVGTRNAMVIAVASLALAIDPDSRTVTVAIGSAAPTPRRALPAEQFLTGELETSGMWEAPSTLDPSIAGEFARLVSAEAAPIDDVRGTASYRCHALEVMARRALSWAWDDYRKR